MLEQRQRKPRRAHVGGLFHIAFFLWVVAVLLLGWNEAPRVIGEMLAPDAAEYPALGYLSVVDSDLDFTEERTIEEKRRIITHTMLGSPPESRIDEAVVHQAWGYLTAYTGAVQHAQRLAEFLLSAAGLLLLGYLSSRTGYGWWDPLMLMIPVYGPFIYLPKILWRATSPEPYWGARS